MFAVEKSTAPGPQGGKPRGYCLAWRGAQHPPQGRGRRSGWYLYRPDAERACAVANEAWRRDLARPARPAIQQGSGTFVVRLVDPTGGIQWIGPRGETPDGQEAVRFVRPGAAAAAASEALGHGPAFWNSERASRDARRDRMRGWKPETVADCDLQMEG